ncbi:MAG: DUF1289 domain-containing protein [Alphaproteobacteria bacterium]|nr:DUF1289 domain-containing protein [Alphaproteobacteria bacterium]
MKSPCISRCEIDPATGWCLGCGRTASEIAAWPYADAATRMRIWAPLPSRLTKLRQLGHGDAGRPVSPGRA